MRKHITTAAALMVLLTAACERSGMPGVGGDGGEIVLRVCTDPLTRAAAAVEEVPAQLYAGMTRGRPGDEDAYLEGVLLGVSPEGTIATGRHQSAVPTPFNHYLSNLPLEISGGGARVAADGGTDLVCGAALQNADERPSVTLRHPFARTGGVRVESAGGYEVAACEASLTTLAGHPVTGTSGVFDLTAWRWISSGGTVADPLPYTEGMLLLPGVYRARLRYTLVRGDFSREYVRSGDVRLEGGCINTITASVDEDEAQEISLGVSLAPWGSTSLSVMLR